VRQLADIVAARPWRSVAAFLGRDAHGVPESEKVSGVVGSCALMSGFCLVSLVREPTSPYHSSVQAFELPAIPLGEDADGIVRVVGSRVTLDSIVAVFDHGATPEEVVQSFPSLALGDVYSILAWVVARRAEVELYLERRGTEEAHARGEVEQRSPTAELRARLLARPRSHSA